MGKVGITAIKELALLIVNLLAQSLTSFKDGFQVNDLKDFVDEAMQAALVSPQFKNLGAEFKDGIDPTEGAELKEAIKVAFIKRELGWANEADIDELAGYVAEAAFANLKVYYKSKEIHDKRKAKPVIDPNAI